MKFGLITQTNWGYRYGTNGLLNGLDYHGNKSIDVHLMHTDEVPEDWLRKAETVFDFPVKNYRISEYMEKYPPPEGGGGTRWMLEFYKYKLAIELAQEYDALMIVDCDYLVLGDIQSYFEVIAGKDLIMTSNNWLDSGNHVNGADEERFREAVKSNTFFPMMNSPCISCPKLSIDLYERIWDIGFERGGEDIVPFVHAVIETGRLKKTIILPGIQWFNPSVAWIPINYSEVNGKRSYFSIGDKMMMAHRHWWSWGEMMGEAERLPEPYKELAMQNTKLLLNECRTINTEWKLPLAWESDWPENV